jgi:hypothetical protein
VASGGSAVLVDQAVQYGLSPDSLDIGVDCGDAGSFALTAGSPLGDALMRPGRVVARLVLEQDGAQMRLTEDQASVYTTGRPMFRPEFRRGGAKCDTLRVRIGGLRGRMAATDEAIEKLKAVIVSGEFRQADSAGADLAGSHARRAAAHPWRTPADLRGGCPPRPGNGAQLGDSTHRRRRGVAAQHAHRLIPMRTAVFAACLVDGLFPRPGSRPCGCRSGSAIASSS